MKKDKKIPKQYTAGLSKKDKEKQIQSIRRQTIRPKLKSAKTKTSTFTEKFKEKYGNKSLDWISKNIIKKKGIELIKKKGIGAYYSSGSRPNQTPSSWWKARLYSVIMGGAARKVDKKIWDKYKIKK